MRSSTPAVSIVIRESSVIAAICRLSPNFIC
jgi:hypothetical protein